MWVTVTETNLTQGYMYDNYNVYGITTYCAYVPLVL